MVEADAERPEAGAFRIPIRWLEAGAAEGSGCAEEADAVTHCGAGAAAGCAAPLLEFAGVLREVLRRA